MKIDSWLNWKIENIKYDLKVIWKVLKQHGNYYTFPLHSQVFYTLKSLICYLLNRHAFELGLEDIQYVEDGIEIADVDGGESFNGEITEYWGATLIVGEGIKSNWWVEIIEG